MTPNYSLNVTLYRAPERQIVFTIKRKSSLAVFFQLCTKNSVRCRSSKSSVKYHKLCDREVFFFFFSTSSFLLLQISASIRVLSGPLYYFHAHGPSSFLPSFVSSSAAFLPSSASHATSNTRLRRRRTTTTLKRRQEEE